ncbi:hypothetical protein SNE40_022761 [Patella caerulea]|uniref:RING-type domain-containing protein n=1 Tax=Patella caerulea TaxID=87958 RepID=A0AAN8FX75_PATCE
MSVKCSGDRMRITEVNPHLICALCGGYLIDATTIVECLHSFCKTCIMRYLETSKYCPICEVLIHKTRPWQNIRLDDTLQNIVYKLVPGLFQREMQRRRDYYDNQPVPSKSVGKTRTSGRIIFSADEEFSISLEFWPEGPNSMETDCDRKSCDKLHDRRYLLCPAAVNMSHLKRFIRNKYSLSDRYQIDIYHTNQPLRDSFSLVDVAYIYSWRREGILRLFYAFYKNEAKKIKLDTPPEEPVKEVEDVKIEPEYTSKEMIFERSISIIETEKKPTSGGPKPVANGNFVQPTPVPVQEETKAPSLPVTTPKPASREATVNTDVDVLSAQFDDDDDEESEMQIVMGEIEIMDDSEPNLEIVIDDKPEKTPIPTPEKVAPIKIKLNSEGTSTSTKSKPVPVVCTPVPKTKTPEPKDPKDTTNQDRVNNNSKFPEKSSRELKPNHTEPTRVYVKTSLPKTPVKDTVSHSSSSKPSFKDSSLQIPRSTVKDTASQVVTSSQKESTSRPLPSPVKETQYRYPTTSQPEKKDTSSRPLLTSPKDTPSHHHSQPKKDLTSRPPLIKDSPIPRSIQSPLKESTPRPVMSHHKESTSRPQHSSHHSKDMSRPVTSHPHSHSYSSSHTMASTNKESFARPPSSPKKESYSHIPSSPNRTTAPPHYNLVSGKDTTSRISNSTIKDTAAQIGKSGHKDSSHSHSIKSMIKDTSSPSPITTHIKHVPQVPRLVKTPITQLKPHSSDTYPQHPRTMIPNWQPHRENFYNGHYKPPQEKPLELKREPFPLDYSKPS